MRDHDFKAMSVSESFITYSSDVYHHHPSWNIRWFRLLLITAGWTRSQSSFQNSKIRKIPPERTRRSCGSGIPLKGSSLAYHAAFFTLTSIPSSPTTILKTTQLSKLERRCRLLFRSAGISAVSQKSRRRSPRPPKISPNDDGRFEKVSPASRAQQGDRSPPRQRPRTHLRIRSCFLQ